MNLRNMIIKIHICLIAFCFISGIKAQTQNSMTEIIPFKTIAGKIRSQYKWRNSKFCT